MARWIAAGRACVNGERVIRPGRRLHAGERVDVLVPKTPRDLEARIDDLLALPWAHDAGTWSVVVKPAGVPCHPAGGAVKRTLLTALAITHQSRCSTAGPWLPHRLDRDTSGLTVVVWQAAAVPRFVKAFAQRRIRRRYRARLHGILRDDHLTIDAPLRALGSRPVRVVVDRDGLEAQTHVRVLARQAATTEVEVEPWTGRQHQIRVHLAHVGHPIVGDTLYSAARGEHLHLHATQLEIPASVAGGPAVLVSSAAPW